MEFSINDEYNYEIKENTLFNDVIINTKYNGKILLHGLGEEIVEDIVEWFECSVGDDVLYLKILDNKKIIRRELIKKDCISHIDIDTYFLKNKKDILW